MMMYVLVVIGLCNILLIIYLSKRIEGILMKLKTNSALIDDVRDKARYLISSIEIQSDILDEVKSSLVK